jgi:hypothetical protein
MAARLSAIRTGRALPPETLFFSASCTDFCYKLSESQGLVRQEVLGKLKKLIHLIESRTRDLPACSRLS